MQNYRIVSREEWLTTARAAALGRWLDDYLVWHSPQLAVAAMRAKAEKHRNARAQKRVYECAMTDCGGQYLAAGRTAAG